MRSLALVSLAIALLLAPSGGASVRIGSTECSVDFGAASGNLACTLAITGGGLTLAGSPVLTTQIAGTEPAAFRYDVLGELVAADIGGDVTSYTYDEAGRLTTLVDPGGETTRYAYDSLGRAVAAGDWAFSYSDVGLIRAVRADGGVVDFQAGERNQPIVIGAVYTDAGGHSFSITLRGRLRTCSACP